MAALEAKINHKLETTNSLLHELLSRDARCRRRLTYQKQKLEEQGSGCHDDTTNSARDSQPESTCPVPMSRVTKSGGRLVPRPWEPAPASREPSNESTREYSELTTTLDYEELKSSTLSTDEDEETAREAGDVRLTLLTHSMSRARSLQLPSLQEQTAVLRHTHSDTQDTDVDAQTEPREQQSAASDSRL